MGFKTNIAFILILAGIGIGLYFAVVAAMTPPPATEPVAPVVPPAEPVREPVKTITLTNKSNQVLAIAELQVFAVSTTLPLTLTAFKDIGQTSTESTAMSAYKALDGNLLTFSQTNAGAVESWTAELVTPQPIERIVFRARSGYEARNLGVTLSVKYSTVTTGKTFVLTSDATQTFKL